MLEKSYIATLRPQEGYLKYCVPRFGIQIKVKNDNLLNVGRISDEKETFQQNIRETYSESKLPTSRIIENDPNNSG